MKLATLKPRLKAASTDRVKAVNTNSWRGDKTTSAQRGYGYAWQKARARHLSSSPLCVYCLREGRVLPASVVDHIKPHRGDKTLFWDESNWQSLCATHHSRDKQRAEGQGRGE